MKKLSAESLFSALANPIRLRCIMLLQQEGELCVCELTQALRVAQPAVSRHLALLRDAGIVQDRRAGLWIHYRLHPGLPGWARSNIRTTATEWSPQTPFAADRGRLCRMRQRPGDRRCA